VTRHPERSAVVPASVPARRLLSSWSAHDWRGGIRVDDLSALERLIVKTANSTYEIVLVAPERAEVLVRGGAFFPVFTPARLAGSSLGGSFLKLRENGVGWSTAIRTDWHDVHAASIEKSDWLIARTRSRDAGGINRSPHCSRNVMPHKLLSVRRALFQQLSRKRRGYNQRFRREVQSPESGVAVRGVRDGILSHPLRTGPACRVIASRSWTTSWLAVVVKLSRFSRTAGASAAAVAAAKTNGRARNRRCRKGFMGDLSGRGPRRRIIGKERRRTPAKPGERVFAARSRVSTRETGAACTTRGRTRHVVFRGTVIVKEPVARYVTAGQVFENAPDACSQCGCYK